MVYFLLFPCALCSSVCLSDFYPTTSVTTATAATAAAASAAAASAPLSVWFVYTVRCPFNEYPRGQSASLAYQSLE